MPCRDRQLPLKVIIMNARDQEIIHTYQTEKVTGRELAKRYGLTPQRVSQILLRSGVVTRPSKQKWALSTEEELAIVALYRDQRQGLKQIAHQFRADLGTRRIKSVLAKFNVPLRNRAEVSTKNRISETQRKQAISMYEDQGFSTLRIAQELGVSQSWVYQFLKKNYKLKFIRAWQESRN